MAWINPLGRAIAGMGRIATASAVLIAAIAGADTAGAQSNVTFAQQTIAPGYAAAAQVLANVLGSPAPEMVLARRNQQMVAVLDTTTLQTISIPIGQPPLDLATGDLDQDGDTDIVTVNGAAFESGTGSISVILQTAPGTFAVTTATIPYPARLFVRDMNQDGSLDIQCGLTILTNNGLGVFTTNPPVPTTSTIKTWVPGDFDGDGDVDLATSYVASVSGQSGMVARQFRRNAGGTWTLLAPFMLVPGSAAGFFTAGDVTGDGIDDLVYRSTQSVGLFSTFPTRIGAVVGGAGTFGSNLPPPYVVSFPYPQAPQGHMRIADMNGDGMSDVVFGCGDLVPFIFLGSAQGTLAPPTGSLFPADVIGLTGTPTIADVDQDGLPDVAIPEATYLPATDPSAFVIYRNLGAPASSPAIAFGSGPTSFVELQNQVIDFHVTDGAGSAACGQVVHLTATPISTVPNPYNPYAICSQYQSPTTAVATFTLQPTPPGQYQLTASLDNGSTASTVITIVPLLTPAAGDGQAAAAGSYFNALLRVHYAAYGAFAPNGVAITWTSTGAVPVTFANGAASAQSVTDLSGDAVIEVRAGSMAGQAVVTAETNGRTATFQLTVLPAQRLVILDGNQQSTTAGAAFAHPLKIAIEGAAQQPIVNSPVTFTLLSGQATLSANAVTTDALGQAQISVGSVAASSFLGPVRIRAATVNGTAEFGLFARGLTIINNGSSFLTVNYKHEHGSVPLLLMADQPLPAPGYQATTFGPVYTSVLAPLPTFTYVDGFGVFGPPNISMVTTTFGEWFNVYIKNFPPLGINVVVQFAAYDVNYVFPENVILSNPVTITL